LTDQPTEKIYGDRHQKLADRLRQAKDTGVDIAPHLVVEARAGTGKTTTLIEGLKRIKGIQSSLVPSPQQVAVWEQMELSAGRAQTIGFVAFNKSIATELQKRVPAGCDAMTMHSLGFRAVQKAFGQVAVNSYRVQDIISELLGQDTRELRRRKPEVIKATEELVGLCKMNLVNPIGGDDYGMISDLASYYDVEVNGHSSEIFDLVPRVLERCKDVKRDNCIDFNDMIWLPVVLALNVYKYDLLLVDECQDLSKVQQELAKQAGRRLILCGDPKQAIYGFAGADAESMARVEKELITTDRGCIHLPLTVTRRCSKAVVKEAQQFVTDFEAFETNPEGKISRANFKKQEGNQTNNGWYGKSVSNGDMVLCRCNAPLVSECFRFLKLGRKATIQGRDVGQGLISTIKKVLKVKDEVELERHSVVDLIAQLDDWLHTESTKERAKRNPSDNRLINLQDKHDCLLCFCSELQNAMQVVQKVNSIFTDDKSGTGIKLSSIHKAKGMEADRVFFLRPEGAPCPHPMAKSVWEQEQERNLVYVAITRAIIELVYVS
jgi:superfamily I DNA/RNA helicase